ncbi:MAG TPA: thioesterase family protein [Pseudonocardiaceae bacterium]
MAGAFYESLGDGLFRATEHTVGPWSPDTQHFGPPSALMARAMERCEPREATTITRVTVEILGPLPCTDLAVSAHVERPGRSVELLAAEITVAGRPVARARAWRMTGVDTAPVAGGAGAPLPPPGRGSSPPLPDWWHGGYLDAMHWEWVRGGEPGRAAVWVRQRVGLVAGEEPSPLQRLLTVADSASGVSSRLDIHRWLFVNTELTVHLHRRPVGEWIGMDAETVIGPGGVGLATSVLHDSTGPVGRSAQSLLVRGR